MKLADRLIQNTIYLCKDFHVRDIRIGLGYTCVELSDDSAGLAATPTGNPSASCTHMEQAGKVKTIVSQGGGTMLLKKHLRFVSLWVR